MNFERVLTDNPIRHMWNRLEVLTSVSGSREFFESKCKEEGEMLSEEILDEKSKGLAFCIRSAKEYFRIPIEGNLTTSSLAFYYGTFSFLKALLLSSVKNNLTLSDIENFTQYGHGMGSICDNTQTFPGSECMMILNNGFFSKFLEKTGYEILKISTSKRYKEFKKIEGFDKDRILKIKDLLSRIPELKGIYVEMFKEHPNFITFDFPNNPDIKEHIIYFDFHHNSEFINEEKIKEILEWGDDIKLTKGKRYTSDVIMSISPIKKELIVNKEIYSSVMTNNCYIKPILGINDPLLLYFMTLYSLSIWVRYRPALWRELSEGNQDKFRPLIVNLLYVTERIIPNIILNRIYNKTFLFAGHSYLG